MIYIGIPETDYTIFFGFQKSCFDRIVRLSGIGAVLAAIYFNYQLGSVPCKIGCVEAYRNLFAEMRFWKIFLKRTPKLALLRRHVTAQSTCAINCVGTEREAFHGEGKRVFSAADAAGPRPSPPHEGEGICVLTDTPDTLHNRSARPVPLPALRPCCPPRRRRQSQRAECSLTAGNIVTSRPIPKPGSGA